MGGFTEGYNTTVVISNPVAFGTCEYSYDCDNETGCENCQLRPLVYRYNSYVCISGSCYQLTFHIPSFYPGSGGNVYGLAYSTIKTALDDSNVNGTILDETNFKCNTDDGSCGLVDSVSSSNCQRGDGVSNADLSMYLTVSPSTSNSCPVCTTTL